LGTPVHPQPTGNEWIEAARGAADALLAAGDAPLPVDPQPPPVPMTVIHATGDGVVAAEAARERASSNVQNIAIDGTHLGLGANRAVLRAIAHVLAGDAQG
jgi:hypothetical protein